MRISFRNGFYAGLLLSVAIGIYLFQLWQPERQVQLHSVHLMRAAEADQWQKVAGFIDETYQDQWGQDRATVLKRLEHVLRYTRNLHITAEESYAVAEIGGVEWSSRLTFDADANEVTTMIKERVNVLTTPFELHWQRKSAKPWDWKLVRVNNQELELPTGSFG